jgi:hypothetical protein
MALEMRVDHVTQTVRSNESRPAGVRFWMSTASTVGLVAALWIAGLPTAKLSLTTFSPAAAAM